MLSALVERLDDPRRMAAGERLEGRRAGQPYRADALRLLVRSADGEPAEPNGLTRQLLPWPTDADPATFGEPSTFGEASRCGVVSGADADAWYAALAGANQLTRWTADGHAYAVSVRPLLPDEARSCP